MVVSNIHAIGPSGRPKPIIIYHPVPPSSEAEYLFKIETADETIDLEDLVTKGRITNGVTTTIGDFELEILDPNRTIYDKITKFDDVLMYGDYGTATNLRFRGKIERPGYQDIYTILSGRSIGMIFDNPVIYNSEGKKKKSEILKEIILNSFSQYSINIDNIEEDTNEIEVNYFEIKFTDIIQEICGGTHDFYLDHEYKAHYFERGSRINQAEAISELANHIETTDNATDTDETYTKVRAYGVAVDDIPLIATSTEDTTETKGVSKMLKLDNNSLTNNEQILDYVDAEAQKTLESPRVGTHSSLFLPTLQPGEKLFVAIPREDVAPGYYLINSFTHEFDLSNEYDRKTTINIIRRRQQISEIMKNRISFEGKITENANSHDMDFSRRITFETDSGTHYNTVINEGFLKVKTGESSGQWISDIINLDEDVSRIEFYMTGELLIQQYQLSTSYLWYSLDGGTTWTLSPGNGVEVTDLTGKQLRLRVDLNSTTAKVKSVQTLFSKNNSN